MLILPAPNLQDIFCALCLSRARFARYQNTLIFPRIHELPGCKKSDPSPAHTFCELMHTVYLKALDATPNMWGSLHADDLCLSKTLIL